MAINNFIGQNERFVVEIDTELAADADPTSANVVDPDWKPFGSINNKSMNWTTENVENTTDDTGAVGSVIATGMGFEIDVSGYATDSDDALSTQNALREWYLTKVVAQESPNAWLRFITPVKTYYAYCFANSTNMGGGSKDVVTFEMNFVAVATGVPGNPPIQVEDTSVVLGP